MKSLISLLSLLTFVSSSYLHFPRVVHEKRNFLPDGWSSIDNAVDKDSGPIRFRFTLKQSNIELLEEYLMDVAHPDSSNYGRLWTPDQVKKTFASSDETISVVKEWLFSHGVGEEQLKLLKDQGSMEVAMSIATAEALLDTKYNHFRHEESGNVHLACESYSLPKHVAEHVDFVWPGIVFPSTNKKRSIPERNKSKPNIHPNIKSVIKMEHEVSPNSLSNCSRAITPACLRALYDFHYQFEKSVPNAIAITEFTPQSLLFPDLDSFFQMFAPELVGQRPVEHDIDGAIRQMTNQTTDFFGESPLDFEYAMSLVGPQEVELFQIGDTVEGFAGNDSFNNLLDALDKSYCTFEGGDDPQLDGIYPDPAPGGFNGSESCGTVKAKVVSTSYSAPEHFFSDKYYQRQCNEFGKLGLLGSTFLYSSGDDGVGAPDGCLDETGQPSPNGTRFSPQTAASCAFVTSVGATSMIPGSSVSDPEIAANFSGGGFSNLISRPSYQDQAVLRYLQQFAPEDTKGHFNESGRGFPDISLNGMDYTIITLGEKFRAFGTSASTPVMAAMITAINDARMKVKKGPVGFINPALYSKRFQEAFNDITNGSNPNCGTGGFVASTGWDPLTGLGTPNFPKMLELFLSLP